MLRGVPLQWVGVLQARDDPADLLLLTSKGDYSGTFHPWNASMPLASFTGGVVRSRDGGRSWAHVAQQPPTGRTCTTCGANQALLQTLQGPAQRAQRAQFHQSFLDFSNEIEYKSGGRLIALSSSVFVGNTG